MLDFVNKDILWLLKPFYKSTYMDDSLDSVQDDLQGIQLYQQLSKLWGEAGMRTHK